MSCSSDRNRSEASKKRQSTQVSKRGRFEGAILYSSDRNESHRSERGSLEVFKRVSTRAQKRSSEALASIIEARIEASIEPRHGSIEARCGSVQETSMGELRHGSIETRRGRIEEASIGGSDDRTKLAIEAIHRSIEEATKHPGVQARKGRRSNTGFERSKRAASNQARKP